MKKTLTINISGIIFHIDEDAYDKLNAYLDTLKLHFSNTQGKDEIIADIEGRIAELLQERITDSKQVITIEDISEVIGLMGEPREFEAEAGEEEATAEETTRGHKRLFRDPDRKMIGGVAAGLAAYLNVELLWVRIAFAVLTLFWLSGTIVYLILWIVLPEAQTTAEKLQMRGEKVNIDNIEKSIREEVSHLKDKLNDLTNQAKKKVETHGRRGENIFEQILGLVLTIVKIFVRILVIIIGISLLITGIALILAFLFALFGWGGPVILDNSEVLLLPLTDFFTLLPISAGGAAIFKIGLILFIGIPLLMLIYNAFRMIFGIERVRYVGITSLNVWIIGLIICLFFTFRIGREYRHQSFQEAELKLSQPAGDTLYLKLNEDFVKEMRYKTHDYIEADNMHLIVTEDGEFFEQIDLNISKSYGGEYALLRKTRARGPSVNAARREAEDTRWYYKQTGDTLILDPCFRLKEQGSWRAQHIELELDVPIGKYLHLDENMVHILHWGRHSPHKMAGNTWLMSEEGCQPY